MLEGPAASHLAIQVLGIIGDVRRGLIGQQPVKDVKPDVIEELSSPNSIGKPSIPQETHF